MNACETLFLASRFQRDYCHCVFCGDVNFFMAHNKMKFKPQQKRQTSKQPSFSVLFIFQFSIGSKIVVCQFRDIQNMFYNMYIKEKVCIIVWFSHGICGNGKKLQKAQIIFHLNRKRFTISRS